MKNEALNHIDDQTTDDGVTREKEAGINKIEQVNIVPVIKPNARQTINEKQMSKTKNSTRPYCNTRRKSC